jgi:RNA polymerase sigma factor (sigma-70 family)
LNRERLGDSFGPSVARDLPVTASAEPTLDRLRAGDIDGAWNTFVDRYRRLIFAQIRRATTEPDEVMDIFAHVCECLRENDLARLKTFAFDPAPRASFSTWLVAVVRNLIVDWFRARDGRSRAQPPRSLSPLGKRMYELIFLEHRSHREACELALLASAAVTAGDCRRALREAHRAAFIGAIGSRARPVAAVPFAEWVAAEGDSSSVDGTGEALRLAMQMLDAESQLVIQLFVVEEMAAADIARMLHLGNAKAVYNRVYRGLSIIREALAGRGIHKGDL